MLDNILKNPIILGLIVGIIAYLYIRWDNQQEADKRKSQNIILDENDDELFIPITLAIITAILAYCYLDEEPCQSEISNIICDQPEIDYEDIKHLSDIETYKVSKHLRIPERLVLPPCFFETF
jgi:hypothetical protein